MSVLDGRENRGLVLHDVVLEFHAGRDKAAAGQPRVGLLDPGELGMRLLGDFVVAVPAETLKSLPAST